MKYGVPSESSEIHGKTKDFKPDFRDPRQRGFPGGGTHHGVGKRAAVGTMKPDNNDPIPRSKHMVIDEDC